MAQVFTSQALTDYFCILFIKIAAYYYRRLNTNIINIKHLIQFPVTRQDLKESGSGSELPYVSSNGNAYDNEDFRSKDDLRALSGQMNDAGFDKMDDDGVHVTGISTIMAKACNLNSLFYSYIEPKGISVFIDQLELTD